MDRDYAQLLLRKVRNDYQIIADQFSDTRSREMYWPEFDEFRALIRPEDRILDAGCGNGRITKILDGVKVEYLGIDASSRLIENARKLFPRFRFEVGEVLHMPFPDGSFDCVFSIAVIHQIPSRELRLQAIREMHRVLKSPGRLFLTVWNLHTSRRWKIVWANLRQGLGMSKLDHDDILVPWKRLGVDRYYHAFQERELRTLIEDGGFAVARSWISGGVEHSHGRSDNFVVIARKE
ncbi:MAG: methyltransferase domain-containing protein [bacterium]|nr:methyltransferase domain-containing protein [bacterium]